jgi:hypothetical protein
VITGEQAWLRLQLQVILTTMHAKKSQGWSYQLIASIRAHTQIMDYVCYPKQASQVDLHDLDFYPRVPKYLQEQWSPTLSKGEGGFCQVKMATRH